MCPHTTTCVSSYDYTHYQVGKPLYVKKKKYYDKKKYDVKKKYHDLILGPHTLGWEAAVREESC